MICPACLTFGLENEAVSTVSGTSYCGHHAIQALAQSVNGHRRPANYEPLSTFTPPPAGEVE